MPLKDLTPLLPAFEKEFTAMIQPPGDGVDREQLFVALGNDQQDRPRFLELIYLPGDGEPDLLQLFVGLPFHAEQDKLGELSQVILAINAKAPLIGFGLLAEAGEDGPLEFFRCTMPCPPGGPDPDLVLSTAWTASFEVDVFSSLLEQVGSGEITLDQALSKVEALIANPDAGVE